MDQTTAAFTLRGDPTVDGPLPAIAINSAGHMFGANNSGGSGSPGTLIRIDPATGLLLGTVGAIVESADAGALTVTDPDFQPATDILFGIVGKGAKEGFLYAIPFRTIRRFGQALNRAAKRRGAGRKASRSRTTGAVCSPGCRHGLDARPSAGGWRRVSARRGPPQLDRSAVDG